MATNQESISIDTQQKIEILRYMEYMGITSLSGGVRSLIHRGLHNNSSNRNKGGGVPGNEDISDGEILEILKVEYSENNPPSCFGIPGTGYCEQPCPLKLACAINYSNSFSTEK